MSAPVYRSVSAATLRATQLDELTLVYHRASGITHILAPPAPEILDALAPEALTGAALLARLGDEYDLGDADSVALLARLDELVAAGLVERR
ncbi:MAG: HPr-rel-A system PqqD family protein [Sphingomonas sp. 28-62-20]|uniref:HPr-rel-A system PqqD family peptide chaperone n=1 Tax=Sphingomonas sp. 28-62-20 TaxID=1970433 RepID=UPI000A0B7A9E|nr:MAG: HPr-rel-A system PqqD family protein [Proteobacteria bacterium ST_bin13]OYY76511.1 MAG: HPr-rel-A system PqqD family protein [Sphingomonas sp. 28-62-20]